MVIAYQAFLTVASPLSAIRLPFSLMQLNLWFMFVSLLGVLLFLFIIWMFFNVALRSRRPELWAGMGRAIERPFHVLGALAGEMLLEHKVSHGVMSLVYMGSARTGRRVIVQTVPAVRGGLEAFRGRGNGGQGKSGNECRFFYKCCDGRNRKRECIRKRKNGCANFGK